MDDRIPSSQAARLIGIKTSALAKWRWTARSAARLSYVALHQRLRDACLTVPARAAHVDLFRSARSFRYQ